MIEMDIAPLLKIPPGMGERLVHLGTLVNTGGSSRRPVRSPSLPGGGGDQLVADAEAPSLRALQTALGDVRPAAVRTPALGGQLLTHLRLHLWVPAVVRAAAFRLVRALGPPAEGGADLGVFGLCRDPLRLPHPPVLHHPGVRL